MARIDMAAIAAAIITLAFAIAGCGDGTADNSRQAGKSGGEGAETGLSGGTSAKTGGSEADDEDEEEEEKKSFPGEAERRRKKTRPSPILSRNFSASRR